MKKILLCANPGRDKGLELTAKVYGMLTALGAEPIVCPLAERYGGYDVTSEMKFSTLGEEVGDADMLIAFGGDGTILQTARAAAPGGIPILGVNLGKKGFIAEIEKEDVGLIAKTVSGEYTLDTRMMLDVTIARGGKIIHSDYALNDAVVGGIGRIIELSVFGDGQQISAFSGDGIVLSTPTGSTAYSMSAGGPIVEPAAENIIITPICAHVLIAKSFVLAPDRVVTVEIGRLGRKSAYLSVDGSASVSLESGDIICVKKSAHVTKLVRVSDRSFYKIVSEKLGER